MHAHVCECVLVTSCRDEGGESVREREDVKESRGRKEKLRNGRWGGGGQVGGGNERVI